MILSRTPVILWSVLVAGGMYQVGRLKVGRLKVGRWI
jgi:hypothetical protein